jgi:ribose transport system ATP-binding protein
MATPRLRLTGIRKRFGGVRALDDVSLSVGAGEVVALIGENGAGKSTLMKILGGVHQPDAGRIEVDGAAVAIHKVSDAIGLGIGFIHQELSVLDNLDVAANIFLGHEPLRGGPLRLLDRARMHADAERYLARLGLQVSTHARVRTLSIGQQQMVEIARALALEARILLMDEPTSSLTATETEALMRCVDDLRAKGVSVIYISHRLTEIGRIADRVVALRDGRNSGELRRDEITHDRMVKLMVGRDLPSAAARNINLGGNVVEVRGLRSPAHPESAVSFAVRAGEIVGFAGLVGAGRTELARVLYGIDRPRGGEILVGGEPVDIRSPADAIRLGIYLVPEHRRQSGCITSMSLRENVTLPVVGRLARGGLIDLSAERRRAAQLREAFSIKCADIEQPLTSLSGGNQQKVVLARWLSLEPRLLIFDEPTRGVDVGAKREIYELMRTLAERGVACMLISSDTEEVLAQSDRIIVMREGCVTGELPRTEFSEEAMMGLAFGQHPARSAAA